MKQIISTLILSILIVMSIKLLGTHNTPVKPVEAQGEAYMKPEKTLVGQGSWYFYQIGDWSSKTHYVCAARDFPRYSWIRITNLDNGKWTSCQISDYGPSAEIFPERIVDLSPIAFSDIADLKLGVINVKVEQIPNVIK
jgi:rare lipoprotein A (peptidoglycan hydrolase)